MPQLQNNDPRSIWIKFIKFTYPKHHMGLYFRVFSILRNIGTPLHELCHAFAAFLAGGQIEGLELYKPQIREGRAILGKVEVRNIRSALVMKLIGLAPLIIMLFLIRIIDGYYHLNLLTIPLILLTISFSFPSPQDVKFLTQSFQTTIHSILMIPTELFVIAYTNSFRLGEKIAFIFHIAISFVFYFLITHHSFIFDFLMLSFFIVLLSHRFQANIYLGIGTILFYATYPFSLLFIALEGITFYYTKTFYHEMLIEALKLLVKYLKYSLAIIL